MIKKIKKSSRGLTFSLPELKIGSRYQYRIDIKNKQVIMVPNENGAVIVSKKKSGDNIKPLLDLRKSEIRDLVSKADYIELELFANGNIVAKIVQKIKSQKSNIISLQEIIGNKVSEFLITPELLQASGSPRYISSGCSQKSIQDDTYFEYLYQSIPSYFKNKKPERKEIKRVYDVISLFSGAGMFDKAFLGERFRFVYGIDFEPAAVETYKRNIGNHIECRDIRTVSPEELPSCDVVIGGPCCQAYSSANRHNQNTEEAEEKRLLIDDYIRLTKAKNPKVWVIENVPEIMTKDQGFYLQRILDGLSEYEVSAVIVNDSKVGGYSKRKRAIIIGSKIGKIELPEQCESEKTVREALSKVDASWYNYNDVTIPREDTRFRMSFVPQGGNWRDIPKEYTPMYGEKTHSSIMRRLKEDEPSITLTNYRKSNILHPTEDRILTVSEAAAISGLDKDFEFLGSLSEKQQMVANGVTQAVGRFVKHTILKALDQSNILVFAK